MDINYHLLVDIVLVSGALSFVLIARKLKKEWFQSLKSLSKQTYSSMLV